jgi:hypothetical protein
VQPQRLCATLIALLGPVYCEQRERLISAHHTAIDANAEAERAVTERKGEGWREAWLEAKTEARRRCRETLADLNRHRAEHGC